MTTFAEFLAEVEREAERTGPEAVAELDALRTRWRLVLAGTRERFHRARVRAAEERVLKAHAGTFKKLAEYDKEK